MGRLVVFELDGVLIESECAITDAIARAHEHIGLARPKAVESRILAHLPLQSTLDRIAQKAPANVISRDVAAWREASAHMISSAAQEASMRARDGAGAILEALRGEGWRLALISDRSTGTLTRWLAYVGWTSAFDIVWSDADRNVANRPNPDALRAIMHQGLALPATTAMVSDKRLDMVMARGAGARAIGVSWGESDTGELARAGAHEVAADYSSLRLLLMTMRPKAVRPPRAVTAVKAASAAAPHGN